MTTTNQLVTRRRDALRCRFDPTFAPVASVAPGDVVTVQTAHAFALYPHEDHPAFLAALEDFDSGAANPMTGPIEVPGAEPGDAVVVRIGAITVDSAEGLSPILDEVGILKDRIAAPHVGRFPIDDGRVRFPGGLEAALRPSIGVIGTSPPTPQSSVRPGPYGGNLDDPSLGVGARIYLPVAVPGAMLSLGDVHGRQGDSEWRAPIEVDATVVLTIERIVKGAALDAPWAETDECWIAYGIASPVDAAIEAAAGRLVDLVVARCGIAEEEALEVLSCVADIRLCTVPGAAWDSVVRAELPKHVDVGGRVRLF
jgi:acetamidase/formamidase